MPSPACGVPLSVGEIPFPEHGDNRDVLINQHRNRHVYFYPDTDTNASDPFTARAPHCTDFAQTGPFTTFYPTYGTITSTADSKHGLNAYATCFDWTILSKHLTSQGAPFGPPFGEGIDAWIYALRAAGDSNATSRELNSTYRNPDRNAVLSTAPQSVHQFGGAVDLQLFSSCQSKCTSAELAAWENEWNLVVAAAWWAGFKRIEAQTAPTQQDGVLFRVFEGPCFPGASSCVHADLGTGPHQPYVGH
jgi:hypothetical protein